MSEMSRNRYSLAKIIAITSLSLVALYQAFTPIARTIDLGTIGYFYAPGGETAHLIFNGGKPCDPTIWQHIYNRSRLQVLSKCITVVGLITGKRSEKDGDKHTFMKVNHKFDYLLNDMNRTHQKGALIVEPVCVGSVDQSDAKKACAGFHQNFPDLQIGNCVEVTGDHVLDREHGHKELHPVYQVTKVARESCQA